MDALIFTDLKGKCTETSKDDMTLRCDRSVGYLGSMLNTILEHKSTTLLTLVVGKTTQFKYLVDTNLYIYIYIYISINLATYNNSILS